MLTHKNIGWYGHGPMSKPCNGNNLTTRRADNDRGDTGKTDFIGVQHGERHSCGTPGIDGVPARLQNFISGCGSKIVTGGNGMAVTVECWAHIKSSAWFVNVKQIELRCSHYSQIETFPNPLIVEKE
jgi:hypothetical protein